MSTPAPAANAFRIAGSDLQYLELTLAPRTEIVGEPGAMMFMDEHITQETVLGDGSDQPFMRRFVASFKRLFTGESMFSVIYRNEHPQGEAQRVAFATSTIGKIIAIDLDAVGGALVCQKGAYLAGMRGIRTSLAMQKKLRVGFFGGEGFIMQRLEGSGMVFINASGTLTEMDLPPGKGLKVDSGSLVALQPTATFDIKYAGRAKTALFGGEGLFFASVRGPGKIWLQSLPMKRYSKNVWRSAMQSQQRSLVVWYLIGFILFLIMTFVIGSDPQAP